MNATKLFAIIIAICFSTLASSYAQDVEKTVRDIRQEYSLVKSQISTLQKDGYAGKLYCLHTIDNKYGKSYPAVGDFLSETYYYYSLEANNPPNLRMVIQTVKSAGKKIYFEALYSESGEVMFVFEQSEYDNNTAHRLFYEKGEIIRYTNNNVETKLDLVIEDIIWISRAATAHKARFDFFNEVE